MYSLWIYYWWQTSKIQNFFCQQVNKIITKSVLLIHGLKLNILFVLTSFVLYSSINGYFPLLFMFIIMTLIIILRIRKVILGTKVDTKKTIIFSVYFIAIASFLVYNSFLVGGLPLVYIVPYLAIAVTAVYCSYMYSKSALSFWELPSSKNDSSSTVIYAKGGLPIYIVYVVGLTIRITINFLFIGSNKLYFIITNY